MLGCRQVYITHRHTLVLCPPQKAQTDSSSDLRGVGSGIPKGLLQLILLTSTTEHLLLLQLKKLKPAETGLKKKKKKNKKEQKVNCGYLWLEKIRDNSALRLAPQATCWPGSPFCSPCPLGADATSGWLGCVCLPLLSPRVSA